MQMYIVNTNHILYYFQLLNMIVDESKHVLSYI